MKHKLHLYKPLLILVVTCAAIKSVEAQTTWSDSTFEKANSAKNTTYFSKEEKLVLFYCNLVRLDPQLFASTYAKRYIDSTGKNDSYTKSLLKTLKTTKSMAALSPSAELFELAKAHAIDFGKKGQLGHGNLKKRFAKYIKECNCDIAENCFYGDDKALTIVMDLLIDENETDLGHRKNMLNAEYKNCGTSIYSHTKYTWNCVIDFSSDSKDKQK